MEALPTLNAILNLTSGVFAFAGYLLIRRKRIAAHRACMLAAVSSSTLFLISYLIYHYHHGATRFPGSGIARVGYLAILISHTVLAAAVVPMVLTTLYRALRGQFARHVRIARWTLPVWLYVSVTGVVVYLMLYHLYPSR
jgi:uncharacterized membrane protein YozB (DUF420 family)